MARIDWKEFNELLAELKAAAPDSKEAEDALERARDRLRDVRGRVVDARSDVAEWWGKIRKRSFFRGAQWAVITLLCMWATQEFVADPHWKAMLWTAGKASMGALLGYWVARTFTHGRPHEVESAVIRTAMETNRAIIIAGAMVAAAFA